MTAVKPMRVLRWENPPAPVNNRTSGGRAPGSRWDTLADQLRGESGRWAVVFEGNRRQAASIVTRIRQASVLCFAPAGSFEACTRSFEGAYTIYARYVGDEKFA